MNHYEVLGIDPSATPDEIKSAWRRKASAAHPDRKGAVGDAAAINRAYETLSDPERRANYDETGSDEMPIDIEAEAHKVLRDVIAEMISTNAPSILVGAMARIEGGIARMKGELLKLPEKRLRLDAIDKKFRVTEGINVVQDQIDKAYASLDRRASKYEEAIVIAEAAKVILARHESDEPIQISGPAVQFPAFSFAEA